MLWISVIILISDRTKRYGDDRVRTSFSRRWKMTRKRKKKKTNRGYSDHRYVVLNYYYINVINVSCPIVSLCRTVIFNWIYGIENNPWKRESGVDSEIVGLNILINRIHDCHYKFHCSFIHWFTLNVFNSFIILASFFCYFEHLRWNNLIKFEHLLILIIEENIPEND